MPKLKWKNCYDCPIRTQLNQTMCPFLDGSIPGTKRSVIVASKRDYDIEPDCPFIEKKTYKETTFITPSGKKIVALQPSHIPDLVSISEEEYEKVMQTMNESSHISMGCKIK